MIMKIDRRDVLVVLISIIISAFIVANAFAGASGSKSNEQTNKDYEIIEGMLALKEFHGDFLVRLPDGKTKRFKAKAGAEITRNGKPVGYSELKVRDNIQVEYDGPTRKVIAIHANGS